MKTSEEFASMGAQTGYWSSSARSSFYYKLLKESEQPYRITFETSEQESGSLSNHAGQPVVYMSPDALFVSRIYGWNEMAKRKPASLLQPLISLSNIIVLTPSQSETVDSDEMERRINGVRKELLDACEAAREEHFEDGMESKFSRTITRIFSKLGAEASVALSQIIGSSLTNVEIAGEALRWMSRVDDESTTFAREIVLRECLDNASISIRDGAISGLATMDATGLIPNLKARLEREPNEYIKKRISRILTHLETVKSGKVSSEGTI